MSTPNDFLNSKGYTKPNYVTQSRIIVCELLKEYEQLERNEAYIAGYNNAIREAAKNAKVMISYHPNAKVGEMPKIKSCEVDQISILGLEML
jgi:hypothetical protein